MNMYRYVSEAWPTNLSCSMCRRIFLYLMRLIYFLVAFSSHSFFSPRTRPTPQSSISRPEQPNGGACEDTAASAQWSSQEVRPSVSTPLCNHTRTPEGKHMIPTFHR